MQAVTRSSGGLGIVLLFALACSNAGTTTSPSPSPRPESSLEQALRYLPLGATQVSFTDWAAIRHQLGIEEVIGATPFDAKLEALRAGFVGSQEPPRPPSEASFSGFAIRYLALHYDDWGFDVMDLDWEISITVAGQPAAWALRFRAESSTDALRARLDEYGYSSESLPGGDLRSVTQSELLELFLDHPTELAMATVGLLDDGRTLVLNGHREDGTGLAREVLANGPGDSADASARSVVALLDAPFTAFLSLSTLDCRAYAQWRSEGARTQIQALLDQAGELGTYNVLGIGYSRAHVPIGRIVMGYADVAEAQADLDPRRLLAEEGMNGDGRPYVESAFTVEDARVEAQAIVLDVTPVRDFPQALVSLPTRRDLMFAACPEQP